MKIPILVLEARVTSVIVSRHTFKIFLDVFIIIIKDCLHKGWRKRLFYIDSPHLILFALLTGLTINDLDVETWNWLAS